ncbi:hypothetical protein D3C86_2077770 [compost metagenome]
MRIHDVAALGHFLVAPTEELQVVPVQGVEVAGEVQLGGLGTTGVNEGRTDLLGSDFLHGKASFGNGRRPQADDGRAGNG